MKIAVIGAGIVGITTAYELACDGHQVYVIERHQAAAEEASFANAGILATSPMVPWAAMNLPGSALGGWLNRRAALSLALPLHTSELAWLWRGLRAARHERWFTLLAQQQRLATYSRHRRHQITATLKLEYERSDGRLLLLHSEQASLQLQPVLQRLRDSGVILAQIDATQARTIEPALAPGASLFGAIHFPEDEVGNCRQFALLLKNEALRLGVRFSFGSTVTRIASKAGLTLDILGEKTARSFDAVVVCAGLASARLVQAMGLKIPFAGVCGYSVSAMIREPLNAPRSGVTDQRYNISITRLGQRVRISGAATLGGAQDTKDQAALARLYRVLHDWFPGAVTLSGGVQEWKGSCAMLPDGGAIVGASGIAGVWLNLGHGANGWASSCGSARLLADAVAEKTPEIDTSGLGIDRLQA
jgi:D-amino-acid dehydrogenase